MANKRFKWTIEVEVDQLWVEDGFDLTDDRAQDIFLSALPYAHGSEVSAKVTAKPSKKTIRKVQGYVD